MNVCGKCGVETGGDARFCKACGSGLSGKDSALINEKKARVMAGKKKGSKAAGAIAGVLAAALSIAVLYFVSRGKADPPLRIPQASGANAMTASLAVQQENGEVKVPAASLGDGKAGFYAYSAGDKEIRFFALRKPDGSIGVALDACNACYGAKKGYRQEGSRVICNNCGMIFRPEDVGVVTGGCNPIPVASRVAGDSVIVKAADLEKGKMYF